MTLRSKTVILFIISLSISLFLFLFAFFYSKSIVTSSYKEKIENNFFEIRKSFDSVIDEKRPILNTIANHDYIKRYIQTNDKEDLQRLFIDLLNVNRDIFQIRLLDLKGKEQIKINKIKDSIQIIEKENLQNKQNRYYVKDFLTLKKGEIGFSYIDVNIENGKIERPYKATLRTGILAYKNNKEIYLIIINYNMNRFLESVLKGPNFNKYLIDKEGYFLINKNENLNWSKYLEKKIKVDDFFDIDIVDNSLINKDSKIILKEIFLLGKKYYILYEPKKDLNIIKFIDQSKHIGILLFLGALFLLIPFLLLLFNYLKKLKNLNSNLIDSRNKIETILNNTSDAIVVINKKGIIQEVNKSAKNMFGYKKEELINKNVNILIPNPHHDKHDEYLKNHDKNLQSKIINQDRELYGLHKDGSFITLILTVTKVEIDNETYFIGNIKDLTQESRSKKLFENVFDTSPVGIALVLEDGSFWKISKKFCSIVGYEKEELINMTFKDITHKDDLKKDISLLEQLLKKEINGYAIEKRYIKIDGTIVWVKLIVKAAYIDEKENQFDYFIATVDDITEENKIKNELLETQKQLIEAEDIAQIGHWNYNLDTQELKWSKNILNIFGNKEEFSYDDFINSIVEDERAKVINAIEKAILEYKKFDIIYKIKIDDQIKIMHAKGKINFDNRTPKNFLGTCQDITEIKRLEEEKNQKEHILMQQSKLAAMGEMTSAIAHQWRQPLNSIGFIIQDLISAYKHNEFNEEYLYEVKKEVMEQLQYMSDTIDEFRKFFKKDEPKMEFNIINTIFEVNKLYIAQLNSHRIKLIVKVDDKIVKNSIDLKDFNNYIVKNQEGQLKQVILNCVSNAKDAILNLKGSSDYEKQILIELKNDKNLVSIAIKDLAGGISKENSCRLFEPYFTTKNMGTGLGLYICKSICEKSLNGSIEYNENIISLNEKEYKGSAFIIKIPK